ncbi:MAG: 6-carboxytetrahydropterin synthase [Desulfobulbaceae bacterium]|jgi:6-pyruvoyltetrahydropterin/6-carboxytetrahydropterin synthase|nr:6-carboxytetrahydropterin synthase [Desulfobulbaceae bacterium]
MYSLGVRREFSARHYLIGGDWGAENIEHTHRYRMELALEALTLDRHGFLVDIVEVEQHLEAVLADFAGRTLNELASFSGLNPSIERLATILHAAFSARLAHFRLEALTVTLWEDDIAWTSYRAPL